MANTCITPINPRPYKRHWPYPQLLSSQPAPNMPAWNKTGNPVKVYGKGGAN